VNYTCGSKTEPQIIEAHYTYGEPYNPNTGASAWEAPEETVYFAVGVPEIHYVKETAPGSGGFTTINQLSTYGVFNNDWTTRSINPDMLYSVEALFPVGGPNNISITLSSCNPCGNVLSSAPSGAVAPISNQLTLTKVEETARFARYRSGSIQNTQEFFRPGMPIIELPTDRLILQGIVDGSMRALDPNTNIAARIPCENTYFAYDNGMRRTTIAGFVPDPLKPQENPTTGIFRIIKIDHALDPSANPVVSLQSPVETINVTLHPYQPGVFRSDQMVAVDKSTELSWWPAAQNYTVVRTTSDTSNNLELRITGSDDGGKEVKSALLFWCFPPKQVEGEYDFAGVAFNTQWKIIPHVRSLGYEETATDFMAPAWLCMTSTSQTIDVRDGGLYYTKRFSLLYADCHGYPFDAPGQWDGLCLGFYDNGFHKRYAVSDPTPLPQEFLRTRDITSTNLANINDYWFVFINACRSAANTHCDGNTPLDPYVMHPNVQYWIDGFNTHCYMGWQASVTNDTGAGFARAFFKVCADDKNYISVGRAKDRALEQMPFGDQTEAGLKIKILPGHGETNGSLTDTFSFDQRPK